MRLHFLSILLYLIGVAVKLALHKSCVLSKIQIIQFFDIMELLLQNIAFFRFLILKLAKRF